MNASPCVYLAADIEEAKKHGGIIIKVEYDPGENPEMNNYVDGCWQLRVYEPIYNYTVVDLFDNSNLKLETSNDFRK